MSDRLTFHTNPRQFAEFLAVDGGFDEDWKPSYNVAPPAKLLCLRDREEREFFRAGWGLIPSWAKEKKIAAHCIIAKAETVAEKLVFQAAFRERRCVIVADGLFGWRLPDKQPFYYTLKSGEPMLLAGLWEAWQSPDGIVETCAICVTQSPDLTGTLQDKMPVILPRGDLDEWLDPHRIEPAAVKPLLLQAPAPELQVWAVSKKVNSVRNNDPSIIEPVIEKQKLTL